MENKVLNRIKKARRGVLFFTDSFMNYGEADAIRKALERLVKSREIERVAPGMYVRPKIDTVIGKITPSIDEIAKAIARRDRVRIVPTGVFALNRLGLSTQVPLNAVYLTNGTSRKITIGNRTIVFKKTTPKNIAAVGEISGLVIQALRIIGKKNITENQIKLIKEILSREEKTKLEHDMRIAPVWIREIMKSGLRENHNVE